MANTFKLKTDTAVGTSLASAYTVPSSTTTVVIGMCFAQTDVIKVYASTADLSFNLFGVETS